MRPRPENAPVPEASGGLTRTILAISVGLILILGVFPEQAIAVARLARPRVEMATQTSSNAPPAATIIAGAGLNRRTTEP